MKVTNTWRCAPRDTNRKNSTRFHTKPNSPNPSFKSCIGDSSRCEDIINSRTWNSSIECHIFGIQARILSSPKLSPQAFCNISPLIFDRFSLCAFRAQNLIIFQTPPFRLKVRAVQVKILGIRIGLKLAPTIFANLESKLFVTYLR